MIHGGADDGMEGLAAEVGEIVLEHPPPQAAPPQAAPPEAAGVGAGFEALEMAGPEARPIRFPQPTFYRGRREDGVVAFNPDTGSHEVLNDVLFRDFSDADGGQINRAYWKIPGKATVETRMGHIEFRYVLIRLANSDDDEDDEDDQDEEDIVFQITGELVAVKVNYCDRMERLRGRFAEDPLSEIAAMQLVGTECPHVIGCHEVLFDGEFLSVVMPYVSGGDLFERLEDHRRIQPDGGGLPETECRQLFRQILLGLRHLQDKGICHRDLSPENVMIGNEGSLIIDMGMCLWCPYTDPADPTGLAVTSKGTNAASQRRLITPQGQCGKMPYMSREIYLNTEPFDGFAADMWTAGTILFFILTGYSYQRPLDPIFQCMTHRLPELLNGWNIPLSDQAVDLLQKLLSVDPRKRYSLEQTMNHRWLN